MLVNGLGKRHGLRADRFAPFGRAGGGNRERAYRLRHGNYRAPDMALRVVAHGRINPCDHLCDGFAAADAADDLAAYTLAAGSAFGHSGNRGRSDRDVAFTAHGAEIL